MDNENRIQALIRKYEAGTATPRERRLLELHFMQLHPNDPLPEDDAMRKEVFARLQQQLHLPAEHPARRRWLPYAAAVILAVAFGLYFTVFTRQSSVNSPGKTDIQPGGNKAVLTLADGRTVDLDRTQTGIIISNEDIKYTNGNSIELFPSEGARGDESEGNGGDLSLSIPRGGQYQITLPDGTKVMLNAGSTLKYPSRFSGDTRTVELIGEGFFEIKEDKRRPFKLISLGQEVNVLGTSFNVTAYPDEASIRTTLVTGTIQVSMLNKSTNEQIHQSPKVLEPGQQSILSGTGLQIKNADIDTELAWKNNLFMFDGEPLESILRKVSSWYDVDVVYQHQKLRQQLFSGTVSRFENVSQVLGILELTGLARFSIAGRTIVVGEM